MSFFSSASKFLNDAFDKTKQLTKDVADSAKNSYDQLKSPPKAVECTLCYNLVPVPSNLFDWICINEHVVLNGMNKCSLCGALKPKNKENIYVTCDLCDKKPQILVPKTLALYKLQKAPKTTSTFIKNTSEKVSSEVKHALSEPLQFNCPHCDSLLQVPLGAWICQICNTENNENAKACIVCDRKKILNKVKCGGCGQACEVPSSNLINSIAFTTRKTMKLSEKLVYQHITKTDFIICTLCANNIDISKQISSLTEIKCNKCGHINQIKE